MSKSEHTIAARAIVDGVFGQTMTRELWTNNYSHVLPITIQDFDLGAVLPAILYMFRFGHRRGKGYFLNAFGGDVKTAKEGKANATIDRIAEVLAETDNFRGFDDSVAKAILGDLLLCFCLENHKHALGRDKQVQRVAPAHYMASWIDLPERLANLRYVPEMIVALLSDQKGEEVTVSGKDDKPSWFPVGQGFENNELLKAFHHGVFLQGDTRGDRNADRFDEETEVGLDQLLMIRLAQQLASAPDKLRGREGGNISNQRPIAKAAALTFSEDIRNFVRAYADAMPRHVFVELLESCMSIGLLTIITSSFEILFHWKRTGCINEQAEDMAPALFVDCSQGINPQLRGLAEQSMDDYLRRVEAIPSIFMALRLLDHEVRHDDDIATGGVKVRPYATKWLNLLGEVICKRHEESAPILKEFGKKARGLAEQLEDQYPEAAAILKNNDALPNPVWRIAEALTLLQGRSATQTNVISLLDSAALVNRPHGIMSRHPVTRKEMAGEKARRRDVRFLSFTDSTLDYLVHRYVLNTGKTISIRRISFQEFLDKLREKYGFHIDRSPKGMTVSGELLQRNRQALERRLRDLGLLVGVNDAETMKSLRPRFSREGEESTNDN